MNRQPLTPTRHETFCVDDLLVELKTYAEQELQKRRKTNIKVKFLNELDDEKCWIRANKVYLRQILVNLLDNSIRSTGTGYIIMGFHITISRNMYFYVHDTGDSRYYQNDIDLALSRGLVQLMGGEMEVELSEYIGTEVTFYMEHSKFEYCNN
jgi:signal transduction histidine kinase